MRLTGLGVIKRFARNFSPPTHFSCVTTSLLRSKVIPSFRWANVRSASTATLAHDSGLKSFDEIPGPRMLPLIGTFWKVLPIVGERRNLSKMHETVLGNFAKYGPIYRLAIPGVGKVVLLSEPEDFETMRLLEEKYPHREILRPIEHFRMNLSKHKFPHSGVLISNGETWYKLRSKYQARLMKPKSALLYLDEMQQVADDFIARIRLIRKKADNEMPENFQNEFYKWALESVSCVALNTRLGCLEPNLAPESDAQMMITATNDTFDALNTTENNIPIWKIWPTKNYKKLIASQELFTDIVLKHIRKALDELDAKKADGEVVEEASVLEMLLSRDKLSQDDVLLLILDLLMAGIDTTSHSMGFLLYQLARNPDKQAALREEVERVVGDKTKPITPKALNRLSYLKACIRESMRLQPVAAGIIRQFMTDVVIRDYLIPKGARVFAFRLAACLNEKYFPDPLKFIPERWVRGEAEKAKLHPMAHVASMPFGHGVRMCLGRRFAEQEMWLLTAKLVQNFDIQYHHEDIGMTTRLVIIPDQPLKFQFIDR